MALSTPNSIQQLQKFAANSSCRWINTKGWSCLAQRFRLPLSTKALLQKAKCFTHARHIPSPSLSSSHQKVQRWKAWSVFYFPLRILIYAFLRCWLLKLNQASWASLKSFHINGKRDNSIHQNRRDVVAASWSNWTTAFLVTGPAFHTEDPPGRYLIQLQAEDKGAQLSSFCIFAKEALKSKK